MMVSCNMMAYISGDGFPFSTSSPPTIVEKHSFHPIQDKYKYTNNYIYIYIYIKEKVPNQIFRDTLLAGNFGFHIRPW